MPRIIKNGAVTEDPHPGSACTLEQWLQLDDKTGSAVQLEPDEAPRP